MKNLNLKSAIGFSFKTIKNNYFLIYGLALLQTFIQSTFYLSKPYYYSVPFKSMVVSWETLSRFQWLINEMLYPFVFLLFSSFVSLIFIKLSIYAFEHDHQVVPRNMIWPSFPEFLKYIWITFLLMIIASLGFIAFVIPGLIILTTYLFVSCIVVEHPELSPKVIFERSAKLTLGLRWSWVGVLLLVFIIVQGLSYLLTLLLDINTVSAVYTWKHALSHTISQIILTPLFWLSYVFLYKSRLE